MAKQWTVMVYMAADNRTNEDLFADLESKAHDDLDEMTTVGSNDAMDVVVQVDWKTDKPQRLRVLHEAQEVLDQAAGPINTGRPEELQSFLIWAQNAFPSRYYMLVLWGHSARYAFGYDHQDSLTTPELAIALRDPEYRRRRKIRASQGIHILGFDACGMSTIESAYELRANATYMLASEIGMPLPGWPYGRILQAIAETPGIEPEALGKAVVSRFVESLPGRNIALTMLHLPSLDANGIVQSMDALATSLAIAVGTDRNQRELVLSRFRHAGVPTGEPLVDLGELCLDLSANDVDTSVQRAAGEMLTLLSKQSGLILDHHRDGDNTTSLCGVSAYAPHVGRPQDSWLELYDQLDLSRRTFWPRVVEFLLSAD